MTNFNDSKDNDDKKNKNKNNDGDNNNENNDNENNKNNDDGSKKNKSSPEEPRRRRRPQRYEDDRAYKHSHKTQEISENKRPRRVPESQLIKEKEEALLQKIRDNCVDGLTVAKIKSQQQPGLITTKPFAKDDFIVECKGQIYDSDPKLPVESENREFMYEFKFRDKKKWILSNKDNESIGRFIKNCVLVNLINAKLKCIEVDGTPRVIVMATKDIKANDEVFLNYNN